MDEAALEHALQRCRKAGGVLASLSASQRGGGANRSGDPTQGARFAYTALLSVVPRTATVPYQHSVHVITRGSLALRPVSFGEAGVVSDTPPNDVTAHPDICFTRLVVPAGVSQPMEAYGTAESRARGFVRSCTSESMALDGALLFIRGQPAPAALPENVVPHAVQGDGTMAWRDFAGGEERGVGGRVHPPPLAPLGGDVSSGAVVRPGERGEGGGVLPPLSTPRHAASASLRAPASCRAHYEAVGDVLSSELAGGTSVGQSLTRTTVALLASLHAFRFGLGRLEAERAGGNTRLGRDPAGALGAVSPFLC